jgi:hypothetical protein
MEGQQYLTKTEFDKWKSAEFELLKQRVKDLEEKLTPLLPVPEELAGVKKTLEDLQLGVTAVEGDVADLKDVAKDLAEIAATQNGKLDSIAKSVSQGGAETWIPNIKRAWDVPEFRQDMRRVVHGSMRRQGTLWIHNRTGVAHTVLVNNSQHVYVGPGEDREVANLSVGTISTELLGYERPRNWTLGPPNYEQHVNIVPSLPTQVFVARPTGVGLPAVVNPPVVVGAPVVVDSPVVIGTPVVVDTPVIYWW